MDYRQLTTSYKYADAEVAWFKSFCKKNKVKIPDHSLFAQSLRHLEILAQAHRKKVPLPDGEELRALIRDALGTWYFIRALHRSKDSLNEKFKEIYDVFSGPDLCLMRRGIQSQERNFMWELLFASISSNCFQQTIRGTPEPDVIVIHKSEEWAVPCKVAYSMSTNGQFHQVMDGVKQVEKSSQKQGFVAVNVTNLIDHDKYLPILENQELGRIRDSSYAEQELRKDVHDLVIKMKTPINLKRLSWVKNKNPRHKTKAILFFAQVALITPLGPTILSYSTLWHLENNGPEKQITELLRPWHSSAHQAILHKEIPSFPWRWKVYLSDLAEHFKFLK